jgi:two-component system NarL family sensor kinase
MGVGLYSMRERAEELGGTCTVTSRSGAGTEVDVLFPLDRVREG